MFNQQSLLLGNQYFTTEYEVEKTLNDMGFYARNVMENNPTRFLSEIFREKVKSMDLDMSQEARPDISYPTGFLNIDYLMGYVAKEKNVSTNKFDNYYNLGFTDGSYISIVAYSNTGKSTFAEQAMAHIARRFKTTTIFIDSTESGGMTEMRRFHLSGFSPEEYRKRYIIRNSGVTAENIYKRIKMIADTKKEFSNDFLYDTGHRDMYGEPIIKFEPTLYLVDSIAGLMPKELVDDDELAGKSAGAQISNVISQMFSGIIQLLKSANIILICTNHIAQDIQMTMFPKKPDLPWLKQGERIPKGKKATLYANHIIRMDQAKKLHPDDPYRIQGSIVDFSLVKSRTSGNKEPVKMVYDFANGFDPWLSLLEYLKENKMLYGAGASLSFDPEKTWKFSYSTFRDKFYNDKEFRTAFMKNILPMLKKIPIEVNEDAKNTDIEDVFNNPELYMV